MQIAYYLTLTTHTSCKYILDDIMSIDKLPVCADWLANLDLGQRSQGDLLG